MNTDPWVFHPGFVWSLCRHSAITREIGSGDIVVFGSTVGQEWVLDTVLVIDRRTQALHGKIGGLYDRLVLPTIRHAFHPFVGTPRRGFDAPFSFAPAIGADDGHRPFRRPVISRLLSSLRKIKDNRSPSANNAQALVFCKSESSTEAFWNAIVNEVERVGLVLGTAFFHPCLDRSVQHDDMINATPCIEPRPPNTVCSRRRLVRS